MTMHSAIDTTCHSIPGSVVTGNVRPLLHEVRHALQALIERGEETVIDLRALPLGPGEEERIVRLLGTGEVRIRLEALGPSEYVETGFPGVWLSTHQNPDGAVIGRYIEICTIPALVRTQSADLPESVAALDGKLAE